MPIAAIYAALAAFAGALGALLVYHAAVVRPSVLELRGLLQVHDGLIAADGGGAAALIADLQAEQGASKGEAARLATRVGALEFLSTHDVSKIGFVRYNALDDTGSDLSYALALLNREGDGVILSSIYSRTDTRTYGKAVTRFVPAANASEEELQAIERARTAVAQP
jgi:predicted component of type VI protein secretion system